MTTPPGDLPTATGTGERVMQQADEAIAAMAVDTWLAALRTAKLTVDSLVVMLRGELTGDTDIGLRNLNCAALVEAAKAIDEAVAVPAAAVTAAFSARTEDRAIINDVTLAVRDALGVEAEQRSLALAIRDAATRTTAIIAEQQTQMDEDRATIARLEAECERRQQDVSELTGYCETYCETIETQRATIAARDGDSTRCDAIRDELAALLDRVERAEEWNALLAANAALVERERDDARTALVMAKYRVHPGDDDPGETWAEALSDVDMARMDAERERDTLATQLADAEARARGLVEMLQRHEWCCGGEDVCVHGERCMHCGANRGEEHTTDKTPDAYVRGGTCPMYVALMDTQAGLDVSSVEGNRRGSRGGHRGT